MVIALVQKFYRGLPGKGFFLTSLLCNVAAPSLSCLLCHFGSYQIKMQSNLLMLVMFQKVGLAMLSCACSLASTTSHHKKCSVFETVQTKQRPPELHFNGHFY